MVLIAPDERKKVKEHKEVQSESKDNMEETNSTPPPKPSRKGSVEIKFKTDKDKRKKPSKHLTSQRTYIKALLKKQCQRHGVQCTISPDTTELFQSVVEEVVEKLMKTLDNVKDVKTFNTKYIKTYIKKNWPDLEKELTCGGEDAVKNYVSYYSGKKSQKQK